MIDVPAPLGMPNQLTDPRARLRHVRRPYDAVLFAVDLFRVALGRGLRGFLLRLGERLADRRVGDLIFWRPRARDDRFETAQRAETAAEQRIVALCDRADRAERRGRVLFLFLDRFAQDHQIEIVANLQHDRAVGLRAERVRLRFERDARRRHCIRAHWHRVRVPRLDGRCLRCTLPSTALPAARGACRWRRACRFHDALPRVWDHVAVRDAPAASATSDSGVTARPPSKCAKMTPSRTIVTSRFGNARDSARASYSTRFRGCCRHSVVAACCVKCPRASRVNSRTT
jgi:hypothetical protein